MAPPPVEGPKPPRPGDDEAKTNPGVPVMPDYVKGKVKDLAVRMSAGLVVSAVGVAFAVFFALEARAEKLIERRVHPIEEEQAGQKSDLRELGKDMRELYRVTPWVRRSERLEQPFPARDDGGAP